MSVAGDAGGTVHYVDGILSIYRNGLAIVERFRARSAQTRTSPLLRLLEECIDQALEDIEREKQRGITRFGKAFEDGDHGTIIALQQVTIQVQCSLLAKLQEVAAFDDEVIEPTSLIDVADLGRDKSIGILIELRLRLFKATPLNALPMPGLYQMGRSLDSQVSLRTSSLSSQEELLALDYAKSGEAFTQERRPSREPLKERDVSVGAGDGHSQIRRHRHSSIFGKLKYHRNDIDLSAHKSSDGEIRASLKSMHPALPKVLQHGLEHTFFSREGSEDNNSSILDKQSQVDPRSETFSASSQNRRKADETSTSPRPTATSQLSTIASVDSNYSVLSSGLQPTPENNYLGFCKGAAKLQTGDRSAMQKTKEFNDGWSQSIVYYLACSNSKCAFAAHMDVDVIWTKVWDLKQDQGLRFRWTFLAKSHVCQGKVKNNQFVYQCLFCVFLGQQPPVIHGTDLYLDHVSQEHRGKKLSDVVLYRTWCVSDRVCDDSEDFDINLLPLTDMENAELRRQSELSSEDSTISPSKPSIDTLDSALANEPWNEGLSEFHLEELEYTHSLRSFRSKG